MSLVILFFGVFWFLCTFYLCFYSNLNTKEKSTWSNLTVTFQYKLNSSLGQTIVTNIYSLKIVETIQPKLDKWNIKYERVQEKSNLHINLKVLKSNVDICPEVVVCGLPISIHTTSTSDILKKFFFTKEWTNKA